MKDALSFAAIALGAVDAQGGLEEAERQLGSNTVFLE